MRLRRLKLRGAKGLSRGLRTSEIEIDFSRIPNGIIAFVGQNGAGKTTILENLHPYRKLASRAGTLQGHFELKDSCRELEFEIGGHIYLSRILIDAHTSKSEAYLYRDGEPMNDGKVSTYDEAIEKVVGPPTLFFVSTFTAQNADGFAELTASQRKELFLKLLGFEKYELYQAYAKEQKDKLARELDIEQGKREDPEQLTDKIHAEHQTLSAMLATKESKEADLTATEEKITETDRKLLGLEKKGAALESKVIQLKEVQAEKQTTEHAANLKLTELWEENAKAKEARDATQKEIEVIRAALWEKPQLEQAIQEITKLDSDIAKLDTEKLKISEIKNRNQEARTKYQRSLTAFEREKAKLETEAAAEDAHLKIRLLTNQSNQRNIESAIATAKSLAERMDTVPCAGTDMNARCELLQTARDNKNKVKNYRITLEGLKAEAEQIQKDADSNRTKNATSLGALEARKPQEPSDEDVPSFDMMIYNQIVTQRQLIKELDPAGRLKQLESTSGTIAALEERISQFNLRIAERTAESARVHADAGEKVARLAERIDRLETETSDSFRIALDIDAAKRDKTEQQNHANTLRSTISLLSGQVEFHKQMLVELQTKLAESEKIQQRIIELGAQAAEWSILERAFGKEGIPALELDAAGPAVSEIANALLTETFGSLFQISFETTKLTKDEKLKETFEIKVFGEGEPRLLEDLSGGERVWVEKAIAEAITVYNNDNSDKRLETGFSDEADGALDPDNKQHYLEMLRAAHRRAGRYHTILITHTEAIWAQVPQKIVLRPDLQKVEIQA